MNLASALKDAQKSLRRFRDSSLTRFTPRLPCCNRRAFVAVAPRKGGAKRARKGHAAPSTACADGGDDEPHRPPVAATSQ